MPLTVKDLSPALRKQLGLTGPLPNKYRAQGRVLDGVRYDSEHEARRAGELRWLLDAREIEQLEAHPVYDLVVHGVLICRYEADFRYVVRKTGRQIVEDAKGVRTPAYRIKKKLMKAVYGIDVQEV